MITGTLRNEYAFTPVVENSRLQDDRVGDGWVGMINRVGVGITADAYTPMGFLRQQDESKSKGSVIIVPEKGVISATSFDSLAWAHRGVRQKSRLHFRSASSASLRIKFVMWLQPFGG